MELLFPAWMRILREVEPSDSISDVVERAGLTFPHGYRVIVDLLEPEGFLSLEKVGRRVVVDLTPKGLEWQVFLREKEVLE